jgi:hypothetical protein
MQLEPFFINIKHAPRFRAYNITINIMARVSSDALQIIGITPITETPAFESSSHFRNTGILFQVLS